MFIRNWKKIQWWGADCSNIHVFHFLKFSFSRKTFSLGSQEDFNLKNGFNKTDMKFTFFVPSDQAWDQIKKQHASAYKVITFSSLILISLLQILFMGDFYYQVHHVLERHLKVGAKMSLADLVSVPRSPPCDPFPADSRHSGRRWGWGNERSASESHHVHWKWR